MAGQQRQRGQWVGGRAEDPLELVRDMLGHKSVNTTTLYYAGMETKGALRRYDEQVLRLREGEASPPRAARRRA